MPSPDIRPYTIPEKLAVRAGQFCSWDPEPSVAVQGHIRYGYRPDGPGVYEILHTGSGFRYIGSSKLISRRFYGHLQALKANRHHARKLQALWNTDGEAAFEFRLIRYCHIEDLHVFEQAEIDTRKKLLNGTRSVLGPANDPDVVKRMKESQDDPVMRAMHASTMSETWRRWKATDTDPHKQPEFREKRRRQLNALWADPVWRAKSAKAIADANRARAGEKRPKQSVSIKASIARRRAERGDGK